MAKAVRVDSTKDNMKDDNVAEFPVKEKRGSDTTTERGSDTKKGKGLGWFGGAPRFSSEWFKSLPNRLTWSRMLLIPVFVILAPWDKLLLNYLAAMVFAVAALTDFFDGYFARKFHASSRFGEILDPLSDKALFVTAAVVLASRYPVYMPLFVVLVVREVMVMGLRALSLERGQNISVSGFGKLKTVCLDVAVVCLVIGPSSEVFPWMPVGFLCLLVGTGLSLYSGWRYLQKVLTDDETTLDHPS